MHTVDNTDNEQICTQYIHTVTPLMMFLDLHTQQVLWRWSGKGSTIQHCFHIMLEDFFVCLSAPTVPGCHRVREEALCGESVGVYKLLLEELGFPQTRQKVKMLLSLTYHCFCAGLPGEILNDDTYKCWPFHLLWGNVEQAVSGHYASPNLTTISLVFWMFKTRLLLMHQVVPF